MKSISSYASNQLSRSLDTKNTQTKPCMRCQNRLKAQYVCINNICNIQNALMCNDPDCSCKNLHNECFRAELSSVIMTIQAKAIPLNKIRKDINEMFQNAIDQLSDMRDKFMLKYQGLFQSKSYSKLQQQFYKSASSKFHFDITGKLMSQIYTQINNRDELNKIVFQSKQALDQLLAPLLINIDQFSNKVQSIILKLDENFGYQNKHQSQDLNQIRNQECTIFRESKLIRNSKEQIKLWKSYDFNIEQLKLIYQSSQQNNILNDFKEILVKENIFVFRTKQNELIFNSQKLPIIFIEEQLPKLNESIQYPSFSKKGYKSQLSKFQQNQIILNANDFQFKPEDSKQNHLKQRSKPKSISFYKNQQNFNKLSLIYNFQNAKYQHIQVQNWQVWKIVS